MQVLPALKGGVMKVDKGSYSTNIELSGFGFKATFSNGGRSLYGDSVADVLIQLRDNKEITAVAFESYMNAVCRCEKVG